MIIDIIGAGIGGLTTAIALEKIGIKTRIFEQAPSIKPVGAGIILANNAMQVYEQLGLRAELENAGNPISAMNITDAQLEVISSVDLGYFEKKYQVRNTAIHRGQLQEILLAQLDQSQIYLNHELTRLERQSNGFSLVFKHGETVSSTCILGADGLNSTVRNQLFQENKIRNAFQVCWRGITDFVLPQKYQHELNEAWGTGDRIGFVQIAAKKTYWYALKSFRQSPTEFTVDHLGDYFRDYHPIIPALLSATPKQQIHTAVITDLAPITQWYQDHVCLIGDAAHATTPNMGQGACQAIEDAIVLAQCIDKYAVNQAFAKFQRLRSPKARQVVNASWRLGKIAHWKHPLAVRFRNQLMRITPESIGRQQSEKIFRLNQV